MKLLKIGALSVASLAIFGSTALAVTPTAGQCTGFPTVNIPASTAKTLNVSNTNIVVGASASVKVNGNGNCVSGAGSDSLKVTGNNNYVTAKTSSTKIVGTNNFFQSQGGNFVNCGGSKANADPMIDASKSCIDV